MLSSGKDGGLHSPKSTNKIRPRQQEKQEDKAMTAQPPHQDEVYESEESEAILDPGPYDVLMGRGAPSTDFSGNMKFRELVKQHRDEYVNAKRRKDKQVIAGKIIETVKNNGGRFLERVESFRKTTKSGETKKVTIWQAVNDRKTLLVKVKQLMRDVGPEAQEKRSLRREMRRKQELEEFSKKTFRNQDKQERQQTESAGSPPPLPEASTSSHPHAFQNTAEIQEYSLLQRSPVQHLYPPFHNGEEALLRIRISQEAALRQESILRHQLMLAAAPANSLMPCVPAQSPLQMTLFGSQRDAFLQQQLRIAQEEALLRQFVQRRPQALASRNPEQSTSLLPSSWLLPAHGSRGTQEQERSQSGSLLEAILRRNAQSSPTLPAFDEKAGENSSHKP